MCRYILPRLEMEILRRSAEEKAEQFGLEGLNFGSLPEFNVTEAALDRPYRLIEEDSRLCGSTLTTSESLIQIISSFLLNSVSSQLNLNVEYQYKCPHEEEDKDSTIQSSLYPELFNMHARDLILINEAAFSYICSNCILDYENNQTLFHGKNCVLLSTPTAINPELGPLRLENGTAATVNGMAAVRPVMREVLKNATDGYLNKITSEFGGSIKDLEIANEEDEEKDESVAVVYFACPFERCRPGEEMPAMELSTFNNAIPEEVSKIKIIVSHDCASQVKGCMIGGQVLFSHLSQSYPQTEVEIFQESSTLAIYTHLFSANYLVCSPGQHCLLPSLFFKCSSVLTSDYTTPDWFKELPLLNFKIMMFNAL